MAFLFNWTLFAVVLAGLWCEGENAMSMTDTIRAALDKGKAAMTERYEELKPNMYDYDTSGHKYGCRWKMGMMMRPTPLTLYMERYAVFYLAATNYLIKRTGLTPSQLQKDADFLSEWQRQSSQIGDLEEGGCAGNSAGLRQYCNRQRFSRYRTSDGVCNNIRNPTWGRANTPHTRLAPPQYGDSANMGDLPRYQSVLGGDLPSAREISVVVLRKRDFTRDSKHTHMLMAMGQFLDHDLTLTPEEKGQDGSNIACCIRINGAIMARDECAPIMVPVGDPHFDSTPEEPGCINFVRSSPAIQTGCGLSQRESLNRITSFVDASNIYGSSHMEISQLRTAGGGLLQTHNNLPPVGPPDTCDFTEGQPEHCLKAGDERVNEVLNLAMMHTAFLREHNRLAKKVANSCRRYRRNNNRMFEETRRIMIGVMQNIVFYEFLPKVLGRKMMRRNGLLEEQYRGYDESVNPSILNEFATAAYRFGHSLVMDEFEFMTTDYSVETTKHVSQTFFKPEEIQYTEQAKKLLRFLTTDRTFKMDREFNPAIQDLLFLDQNHDSFDLPAANTQRGRDHGLAPYMEIRRACRLPTVTTFENLYGISEDDRARLASVYAHVDDIDLFVGGILEEHVDGGIVGPTFACIIGEQFRRLKVGDRYYFERRKESIREFDRRQIAAIKEHSLAKILCENFDFQYIQRDVMKVPNCISNPTQLCSQLPDLDMNVFC